MKVDILHAYLEAAYCQMAQDEQREQEANEWSDGIVEDALYTTIFSDVMQASVGMISSDKKQAIIGF